MSKTLAELTAADFEPHQGAIFRFAAAGGELELKLVEVRRLGQALRNGGAFSLLFLSAAGPFLPQAIYPFTHPALGALELFLVPLGPKDGGNSYEAVFT
jgi:hypothetical protein